MRYVCYGAAVMVLATAVVGCANTTWVVRSYPLGPRPEAAVNVIDLIVTDQLSVQAVEIRNRGPKQGTLYKVHQQEGVVVVRTTREGHRQIEAALKELQE